MTVTLSWREVAPPESNCILFVDSAATATRSRVVNASGAFDRRSSISSHAFEATVATSPMIWLRVAWTYGWSLASSRQSSSVFCVMFNARAVSGTPLISEATAAMSLSLWV